VGPQWRGRRVSILVLAGYRQITYLGSLPRGSALAFGYFTGCSTVSVSGCLNNLWLHRIHVMHVNK
jgi:hypothetical protein